MSRWRKRRWIAVGATTAIAALVLVAVREARVELARVRPESAAPSSTLFRDVAVFDGEQMLLHQDVLLEAAEIRGVGPTGQVPAPDDVRIFEGEGRTLLPGLIDCHVHLFSAGEKGAMPPPAEAIGHALLYAGVTTMLVAAGGDEVEDLRTARVNQATVAPHIYSGGLGVTAPGGHPVPLLEAMLPWPLSSMMVAKVMTAETSEEARERVRQIDDTLTVDFLKITFDDLPPGSPHLSVAALEGAIAEAQARGLRPIVHATTPDDAVKAAEAGAALLVHVPQRGRLSDAHVSRLRATGVPFVSTVRLISASHHLAAEGPTALERESVDPRQLEAWQENPSWDLPGFSEEIDRAHAEVAADTAANFQRLREAGFTILIGTDSGVHGVFPGSSLHRELALLVSLGMSTTQALRRVTADAADFLEPQPTFGRIAPGMRADLVLVRGDPTADLAALAEIEEVFLDGKRLEREALR